MDQANQIICPDCQAVIPTPQQYQVGDILECSECGAEIELTSISPISYRPLIEEK